MKAMKQKINAFAARSLARVGRALSFVDPLFSNVSEFREETPIVVIVGPPRSGTTLTYQALTTGLDCQYVPNIVGHCPMLVRTFVAIQRWMGKSNNSNFESSYGKTAGTFGPSEAGELWCRWFPRDCGDVIQPDDLTRNDKQEIVDIMASVSGPDRKLVVLKNTYMTLRLPVLMSMFPRLVVVEVKRDLLDNAQSILQARIKSS